MNETKEAPLDEEVLMDHEYDGIQEYDNPMPRWWKLIFLGTFVFSLGYLFWFEVSGHGLSVLASYEAEVQAFNKIEAARAMKEKPSEEALEKLMADKELMASAGALYKQHCVQCHAEKGEGNIGPNLTDDHWIHGKGKLMDVYEVVQSGVPVKGMPPWGKQLKPNELRQVVAFVGTLRGTNVPGKEPQGEPVAP